PTSTLPSHILLFIMMFYALALVPLALACGPGTGPVTDKPTLKFTYSPPLSWTYSTAKTGGGQSLSVTAARNRINNDIEFAVLKAVESYGYSTSGVMVKNAVDPNDCEIVTTLGTCEDKKYDIADGAVTIKCSTVNTEKPSFNITSSISVTSPIALAQSNWENIATKVWASLTANAGVKFYGLIEVA
ncbi:hypothetical protein PFISCL1PPCAC_8458, partial [Pristionchus fissidentatus]